MNALYLDPTQCATNVNRLPCVSTQWAPTSVCVHDEMIRTKRYDWPIVVHSMRHFGVISRHQYLHAVPGNFPSVPKRDLRVPIMPALSAVVPKRHILQRARSVVTNFVVQSILVVATRTTAIRRRRVSEPTLLMPIPTTSASVRMDSWEMARFVDQESMRHQTRKSCLMGSHRPSLRSRTTFIVDATSQRWMHALDSLLAKVCPFFIWRIFSMTLQFLVANITFLFILSL
jgi:hypothetical protein